MFKAIRKEFELHSMKLAGFAAAFTGSIIYYQDLLFTLLSLVPVPAFPRAVAAIGIAALVYLGPRIARYWPQPDVDEPTASKEEA